MARMVTRNLSLGGVYCISNHDFPEMTRLSVRLMLPSNGKGSTDEPVDVEAVIVRREEMPSATGNGPRYEFALYFTRLEGDSRQRLKRYIESTVDRPAAAGN